MRVELEISLIEFVIFVFFVFIDYVNLVIIKKEIILIG